MGQSNNSFKMYNIYDLEIILKPYSLIIILSSLKKELGRTLMKSYKSTLNACMYTSTQSLGN